MSPRWHLPWDLISAFKKKKKDKIKQTNQIGKEKCKKKPKTSPWKNEKGVRPTRPFASVCVPGGGRCHGDQLALTTVCGSARTFCSALVFFSLFFFLIPSLFKTRERVRREARGGQTCYVTGGFCHWLFLSFFFVSCHTWHTWRRLEWHKRGRKVCLCRVEKVKHCQTAINR